MKTETDGGMADVDAHPFTNVTAEGGQPRNNYRPFTSPTPNLYHDQLADNGRPHKSLVVALSWFHNTP